ncbi:glycosyltransferase 87 family protein [Streptomyces sp. NPDC000345]|uniref:glycosyltransferase 87 family protein n=1 Tax=Streptomyces sp. NPDC000345 TaxID=3364537 RepID=UPI00369914E9
MERRRLLLALAAAWLATRALMLWLLAHDSLGILGGRVSREVWRTYHHWYGVLSHGAFPAHDTLWQYPPGAGVVLLSPGLLPWWTYFQAFVALTVLSDAAVACALARAGTRPGRTLAGAAVWVGGLPLLVRVPFARYDVQVTALAVISLLALSRSTRVGGAFAALGALVKVWPVLVLVGVRRGRETRSVWASVALTGAAVFLLLVFAFRNPLAFLLQQGGRGVQIESLGGTLLSLATHADWPGKVHYRYGAMEFTGPYVSSVAHASLALTAVAFGLLLWWRIRARHWTEAVPYDAALSAVLLFTVTSRVISPQYMIWLVGLAAVCLTSRHTTQRPVAALILASTALSAVIFPVKYGEVIECTWTGTGLMVLRNGLLLAAAALSYVRLWRASTARAAERAVSCPQALHGSRTPASL